MQGGSHIEHDILFRISEYMATIGYRQYLWRGLHIETMLSAGMALVLRPGTLARA